MNFSRLLYSSLGAYALLVGANVALAQAPASDLATTTNPALSTALITRAQGAHGCMTSTLLEAHNNPSKLSPEARAYFKNLLERPTLSGTEAIYKSQYFDIHYTLDGKDAVDPTSGDPSGAPDHVVKIGKDLDQAQAMYVQLGYPLPPPDVAVGGTDRYDVYIMDIQPTNNEGGLYGYVAPENTIGDNPNSAALVEKSASTSFMAMDSKYAFVDPASRDAEIKSTAVHEFFHAVQMGLTTTTSNFIAEATAVWSEGEFDSTATGYYQYFPNSIITTPDVALNLNSDDGTKAYGDRWYGNFVFFRYMTERFDNSIIRKIYERLATVDGDNNEMLKIDEELQARGSSFRSFFRNFLASDAVMQNDDSYSPYTYAHAQDYRTKSPYKLDTGITVEKGLAYVGSPVNFSSETDGNGRLMRNSVDYIEIKSEMAFSVSVKSSDPAADLDAHILKISPDKKAVIYDAVKDGDKHLVDMPATNGYDKFYLMVVNYSSAIKDTASQQYTFAVNGTVSGVEDVVSASVSAKLYPAMPNPALGASAIRYTLSHAGHVTLNLFDATGHHVRTLVDAAQNAGDFTVNLDGNGALPAGAYFYELATGHTTQVQPIVIAK